MTILRYTLDRGSKRLRLDGMAPSENVEIMVARFMSYLEADRRFVPTHEFGRALTWVRATCPPG